MAYRNTDRWVPKTCNTIDDVTGLKVKLNKTSRRWDGVLVTRENYEERQPQDFLPSPRPVTVYPEARSEAPEPAVTAYNPANGWSYP